MAFPKIDGYVVTEKLGSGSYSTVYKAHTKVGARSIVAIKCVDKSSIKNSGSAVDNLITEIRLLKSLTHPHIVNMINFTWDDRNIYIIMEYCCGGDLSKYIHRYGRVPENQVLYFLQQLASALKFLREKGVVHMDLKPHNLLLHKDSNGKYLLKVADFGFAQYMSTECARAVRGSPLYMAPEMISGDYDARVDLWSVGVIMFECLFGKAPYSSNTFKELVNKIQSRAPIEIPRNCSISAGCRDLLTRLLKHDPDERISYEEFFRHEYLDLDHMPSKENYEKAVCLIKQAIEADCAGRPADAFPLYRESLALLVPAVRAETDALRRGALTDKLTRYMERAEEIKEMLKGGSHVPSAMSGSRTRDADTTRTRTDIPSDTYICTGRVEDAVAAPGGAGGGASQRGDDPIQEEPSGGSGPRSRFALKRLFGRQTSLPYLNAKDSSITAAALPAQGEKQKGQGETPGDACRIN